LTFVPDLWWKCDSEADRTAERPEPAAHRPRRRTEVKPTASVPPPPPI